MKPSILVTGATGTTGSALVRQLSNVGIPARALSRNPAKLAALPHIEPVAGDLGDPASLTAAFAGIDAVYLNIVPGAEALAEIDNVIAAAKAAGAKLIVKLSGLHATPEAPSAIIRMHAEGDARVRRSGLDYAIVRANSFFQNIEGQIDSIKATGQFYLPLGYARQSLIDVEDIAAVVVKILTDPTYRNRDLDLTGPEALTFHDVAAQLSAVSGKPVTYVPISHEAFVDSLLSAGMPQTAADAVAELFALFATGIYAEPTDHVKEILGRTPTSLSDYARRLFAVS